MGHHNVTIENLPITTLATIPPGAQVYQYVVADAPGTAASQNFMSVFNPVGSGKNIVTAAFIVESYAIGASTTPNSLQLFRTTAASGGTLVSAANITKYITSQTNSIAEVRTGNPSATLLTGNVPLSFAQPPVGSGLGDNGATLVQAATGAAPTLKPGEGIVFNTAAGNTNQVWNIQLIWLEL